MSRKSEKGRGPAPEELCVWPSGCNARGTQLAQGRLYCDTHVIGAYVTLRTPEMATMGAEGMEIFRQVIYGEVDIETWRAFCDKWGIPITKSDLEALEQMRDLTPKGPPAPPKTFARQCLWGSLSKDRCRATGTVKILGMFYCPDHAQDLKNVNEEAIEDDGGE